MSINNMEIIQRGDPGGNQWIIRVELPSGASIFGLATENVYGGDWDLGPTWNFVVRTENPFLIDTGRYGMGGRLLEMIGAAGFSPRDLKGVLLSHGHEDHDGGLTEIVEKTGLPVWVHPIYDRLCRSYPEQAPQPSKKTFSASCWQCSMPETFTRAHCVDYHRKKMNLRGNLLEGPLLPFDPLIRIHHLPGHSPDSLAFQIGREALIVGDILLPEITPHPSQEALFRWTEKLLPPEFNKPEMVYGLRAYVASLKRLQAIGREHPEMMVLPAHRLFYNENWRMIELEKRSAEIIEHHLQRCASILELLHKDGLRTTDEIVRAHFEPKLLKGFGIRLAESEIKSHLELLRHCGDVEWNGEEKVKATGTTRFERYIRDI